MPDLNFLEITADKTKFNVHHHHLKYEIAEIEKQESRFP